jgi:hypothetical protein
MCPANLFVSRRIATAYSTVLSSSLEILRRGVGQSLKCRKMGIRVGTYQEEDPNVVTSSKWISIDGRHICRATTIGSSFRITSATKDRDTHNYKYRSTASQLIHRVILWLVT